MDEIFKQYGGAILVSFAFLIIITFFTTGWGGDGVLNAIGRNTLPIIESVDKGDVDSDNLERVLNRDRPKVYIRSNLKEKMDVYILDNFEIVDADGYIWNRSQGAFMSGSSSSPGAVYVMNITDSNGRVYYDSMEHISRIYNYQTGVLDDADIGIYQPDTGKIRYPLAGTYTIKLRVVDCDNVEAVVFCRVAVDFVL